MSKTKGQIRKEFTPKKLNTFNVVGLTLMFGWLIAGLAACLAIGFTSEKDEIMLIAILVWLVVLVIISIAVVVVSAGNQKKIIAQRKEEIKAEFYDIPFEEAAAALAEKRVINEIGFIANTGEYAGRHALTFNDATVAVYSANIYTKVCTGILICNGSGIVVAQYILDNLLYNFIFKKGVKVEFKGDSGLLVTDKDAFVEKVFKGDANKTTYAFLFGAVGAAIANSVSDENFYRKTVLKILMES